MSAIARAQSAHDSNLPCNYLDVIRDLRCLRSVASAVWIGEWLRSKWKAAAQPVGQQWIDDAEALRVSLEETVALQCLGGVACGSWRQVKH